MIVAEVTPGVLGAELKLNDSSWDDLGVCGLIRVRGSGITVEE